MEIHDNPILMLFLSYTIGALLTSLIVNFGLLSKLENKNYINDEWTKYLGVLAFGWLVRKTFMGWFNKKIKFSAKVSPEELINVKNEMTQAEVGHLIGFISLQIFIIFKYLNGMSMTGTILFTFFNVVFNFYTIARRRI